MRKAPLVLTFSVMLICSCYRPTERAINGIHLSEGQKDEIKDSPKPDPKPGPKPIITSDSSEGSLVTSVAFAGTDDTVVFGGGLTRALFQLLTLTGRQHSLMKLDPGTSMIDLAISPNKTLAAIAIDAGDKAVVWNLSGGRQELVLDNLVHPGALCFSRDGKVLFVAEGINVKAWDVATGKPLGFAASCKTAIRELRCSPTENILAAMTWEKQCLNPRADQPVEFVVWDYDANREITYMTREAKGSRFLVFSPNGTKVATGNGANIMVWNTKLSQKDTDFVADAPIIGGIILDDNSTLLTVNLNGLCEKVDLATGKRSVTEKIGRKTSHAAFSRDGKRVVTGHFDYAGGAGVMLWERKSLFGM